jgi:proline dehydrogenase
MSLMRQTLLWCSENRWMRTHVPRLWFVRRGVRRFMPGESVEDAVGEAAVLNGRSIGAILTQLGENLVDPAGATAVVEHYQGVLETIALRELGAVVSVKPTQLGLDHGIENAYRNLAAIVEVAAARHSVIWVDMEQSSYVEATLDLVHRIRDTYDNIGVCLQAYLHRTADDLGALMERGIGIRLVKGAYAELADVAYPSKQDVDDNYLALAERMLEADAPSGHLRPAFATHDPVMIQRIRGSADGHGIGPERYQFQMLYGIQRGLQNTLVKEGCGVMVLISYGEAWYPWYIRRLAERPANVWFVVKSTVKG